jgi:plastocyanin
MRMTETACPPLPAGDRAKKTAIARPLAAGDGDVPCDGIGSAISRCAGRLPVGARWWTAVVGLSFAAMAPAANHVVTASPNFTFSPGNLSITAGDTVTFRNGGGFHNVASDPGSVTSFRCANGCDGTGGDGDLSDASWSATVAFPTAGTIGYYCEAHGSPGGGGMAGRITVRAAPTPVTAHWSDFNGDFNGDGRSDILWRNRSTGANVIWLSANSATTQTVLAVSTAWQVVGSGDYDGDGRADILWRNSSTGSNSIWRSANHLTPQAVTGVTNLAWAVVGSGDYNGDGRADILWRNGSTGANAIWFSANSTTAQTLHTVPTAWGVVGSGDYNVDGRADVLWRNFSTGSNSIWRSANPLTPQTVTGVTNLAWAVVGSGDYNGDGRADILWRNGSTGADAIWFSANSATAQALRTVPTTWRVVGSGNYNGDSRADILWRNFSTGSNSIWRSANPLTPQTVTGVTNQAWVVVGASN